MNGLRRARCHSLTSAFWQSFRCIVQHPPYVATLSFFVMLVLDLIQFKERLSWKSHITQRLMHDVFMNCSSASFSPLALDHFKITSRSLSTPSTCRVWENCFRFHFNYVIQLSRGQWWKKPCLGDKINNSFLKRQGLTLNRLGACMSDSLTWIINSRAWVFSLIKLSCFPWTSQTTLEICT